MGKKRVVGRSRVSAKKAEAAEIESSEAQESEEAIARPKKKQRKARPVRCIQQHTDLEFRREFREVCTGLIEKAKSGSTAHTRLLLDIGKSGERKTAKRGGKSLSEMLLDELKRRQDEREAAADKARAEEQQTSAKAGNEDAASVEIVEKK